MLIISSTKNCFDTSEIKRGTLVYAKHKTWPKGEAGFVTYASENEVIVQYPPGIGNVTNHFFLQAEEVAKGNWEIRYTNDLVKVSRFPEGE